ncbi:MAG: DNA-directed RNA polymerase subunit beta', partial [Bacteroidales bacterium]|nr:DNA-directed RNA polymerase subunit beta' [Bacteroidales bacterium]
MRLKEIKPLHCQQVLNEQAGKSKTQVNEIYQQLRFLFRHAVSNGLLKSDPTENIIKPDYRIGHRRALTGSERRFFIKVGLQDRRYTIGLASPEEILARSSGEVLKPETVNYRTYKPERDGLFCERIFGPSKDYECHCGKYKRIRYRGIICDRCGVEVTEKKVRRERMGHITLTVPVAHIWYFRSTPNKIGYLLGIPSKKLDAIIYYERYVVVQPGIAAERGIKEMDLLTEEEYLDIIDSLPRENQMLEDNDPDKFVAGMGAEVIYQLLCKLDLDELSYNLRSKIEKETSQQRKADALKRLSVIEAFRDSKDVNRPEWMILKVIPVTPPDLRPLVPLDGGRFATSDLNDLYRRVIIRNNRLKRLIEIKAPEVILRNEKRMLQEAVDSLFDNSRKSNAVKTEANRTLKSLSDSLKGKQGRFRQNLLGKRVDYSARSVIVVGPELKMHECGLPKFMAAELYKPFIIRKLIERGIVKTVKSAKKIVDRKDPVIWDILENVMKGHPVLLNRAPTLHRLGIQAFQPKLIEGKAIQLHPLACTAFNADFDGDQMAVHLPLGNAAILEAQLLMLGSHNILNPANGAPITVPSQDMVLGLYYITKPRPGVKGTGMNFYGPEEIIIAHNEGRLDLHAVVNVRLPKDMTDPSKGYHMVETTAGRVFVNQLVPPEVGYINEILTKKSLRDIIGNVLKVSGVARTAQFLDDIKHLGYTMAFKGGLSFNLGDVIIPEQKATLVNEGYAKVEEIQNNFNLGLITNNERYNQVIDIWTKTNTNLTNIVEKQISSDNDGFNPVYMMLHSGARGSKEQIRQLCGMRGLMAKPQKSGSTGAEIIENPILSNFKEGLSVLEYFISTHGARKGLADTALKTADAGYLTRRLVDVSHDVIINEEDCGTLRGLIATAIKNKDNVVETLYDRILGRTTVHDVYNPLTGEKIIGAGEEITEDIAALIESLPIEAVEIRSVLTCESKKGVCAKCYGRNLARGKMVEKGEVVGVIAAQSIGEPGTQLTLRTFHVGGTASSSVTESEIISKYEGKVEFEELRTILKESDNGTTQEVVIGRTAEVRIVDANTGITLSQYNVPYGAILYKKDGDTVTKGDKICEWDPYNAVTITEIAGKVSYDGLVDGVTYREEAEDDFAMHRDKVVIESRDKSKNPIIRILDAEGNELKQYNLPVGAHIMVDNNQQIKVGDILIKIPRAIGKSGDITGGLPRVTELFEARNPSNPAIVSEINGEVLMGKI